MQVPGSGDSGCCTRLPLAVARHVANTLCAHASELLNELDFFWTHQVENWTNRVDVADQIDFLRGQVPD